MNPLLSLWMNVYYQSLRLHAKLKGAPLVPYELSYLWYRLCQANRRMSYDAFMYERQDLMHYFVMDLAKRGSSRISGLCSILLVLAFTNILQWLLGVNLWLYLGKSWQAVIAFPLTIVGLSILFDHYVVRYKGRYIPYFEHYAQEPPAKQCLRRWVGILLMILILLGAFPMIALL